MNKWSRAAAGMLLAASVTGASYQRQPPHTAGSSAPPVVTEEELRISVAERALSPDQVVSRLHAIDQMEIEAGRLARQKAVARDVRKLGKLVERDHARADRDVLALAKRQDLAVAPAAPSEAQARAMADLKRLAGPAFDRRFVEAMRDGHDETLRLLANVRNATADRPLAELIDRLVPILKQHDELAGRMLVKRQG